MNRKNCDKNVMMVASVASMIDLFNEENINILQSLGYKVHVMTNFENGSITSNERVQEFRGELDEKGVCATHVPIPRSLFKAKSIIESYKMIKKEVMSKDYEIVHCHSPIGGVVCRMACRKARKKGLRVLYTAHGFHFYKGAPLLNWLIYYPVEKFCSYFTDVLITINKEDYNFAKKNLNAKKVCYVPGIGIDTEKFSFNSSARSEKRSELGLSDDDILILSVGELNENKNHQVVIKALAKSGNKNIHYAIAGRGEKHDFLINLANELGVSERVHLLGYRTDIDKLYSAADICCIASIREGLVVAALEGISCGVPLVSSKCRGTVDYAVDGENAFLCNWNSADEFAHAIDRLAEDKALREKLSIESVQTAQRFDKSVVSKIMNDIYNK